MELSAGQTLSHYRLLKKIGQVGTGEAYLAEDTTLHRRVALRVLDAGRGNDPARRTRLAKQAQAVAALHHPNIHTIYSVEHDQGIHFFTAELIEGRALGELIPQGGLPATRLFEYAIPLADALASAHAAGMTHGALGSDNVMITPAGRLEVLEFGVAGLAEEGEDLDPRSDVLSLGILLHEMATGRRPAAGGEVIHTFPRRMADVVERCLSEDPDRQYSTAREVRNELEDLMREVESGECSLQERAKETLRMRSESPIPVKILGWLHVAAGAASALWIAYSFVRQAAATGGSGIPLFVMLKVAAALFLGVGVGLAMMRGRAWSWYVSTFLYLLTAGAGVLLLYGSGSTTGTARVARLASTLGVPAGAIYAIPVVAALVAVALYAYLFTNPPRTWFGVREQSRWIPLGLQPGIVVAIFVIVALVQPGAPPADTEGNSEALQALGELGADTDDQLQFMVEHLEGGIPHERVSAAWAMGRSGRADAVPYLLTAAREDDDTNVRMNAIDSMATIGGEGVLDALVDLLAEDDEEIRSITLLGLADERYADAYLEAGEFLRSENERLRSNAADALGGMRRGDAVPLLTSAAADPSPEVRNRVAFALGKIGDPRGVPALIAMSKDSSWEVRGNAVQALGMIGDASGRQAVEALLDDPNSQVRFAAQQALSKL